MQKIDLRNKTVFVTGGIGFKPATPLCDGLRKPAQWYKELYRV